MSRSEPAPLHPETCRLLEACAAAPRPYRPRFDWIDRDGGYWIRDQERPIAFIKKNWLTFDAFEFSPFTSLGRDLRIHPRYDMGTYINMHAMFLQAIGGNFRWPSGDCHLAWDTADPGELRMTVQADYRTGDRTTNTLIVSYDPETAQYLYRMHKTLQMPEPRRQEFCNVYMKGIGNAAPSGKKCQYTVWTGPGGRLWKMPHTPAFAIALRPGDPARMKLIAERGFIGWGVEEDFNLVTMIEEASVPVVSATCDMWYDEHLSFEQAGMEHITGGTTVSLESRIRFLNAPAAYLRELIHRAEPVPVSERETEERGCPGFVFGETNDLESAMDPHLPQAGQLWPVGHPKPAFVELEDAGRRMPGKLDPSAHVAWVRDAGHSGQRSIRLQGIAHRVVRLGPAGPPVHIREGGAYRFEGWIRTEGAEGRLRVGLSWYDWTAFQAEACSPTVKPDSPWTRVCVDISNTDYPYLVCRLEVEGDGYAWFDDLYAHEQPA